MPLPPGVSNINHPGLQPMPGMQPLPTTITSPHPNVNYPGGIPSLHAPGQDRGWDRGRYHRRRGSSGVIYYGVPYYVPYYVQTEVITGPAPTMPERGSNYTAPGAPGPAPVQEEPDEEPVTLLAFKDRTVLIVVDYWLEGDWLYYSIDPGQRLSVPLDRLDQPLTQQLNRERNVPFILETR